MYICKQCLEPYGDVFGYAYRFVYANSVVSLWHYCVAAFITMYPSEGYGESEYCIGGCRYVRIRVA